MVISQILSVVRFDAPEACNEKSARQSAFSCFVSSKCDGNLFLSSLLPSESLSWCLFVFHFISYHINNCPLFFFILINFEVDSRTHA